MAITSARMQMRRGLEADFDPDKMQPGEWAVSLDKKYVRMCFSVGVCVRMATYDAFEEDMAQIEEILSKCETIEEAVAKINTEVSANAKAVAEYTEQAKKYRDEAKAFRDEAESIAGIGVATKDKAGIVKPDGETITVDEDGTIHANGSQGTIDYEELENKPQINGVELSGNKSFEELGFEGTKDYSVLENKPSINGTELSGNKSLSDLGIASATDLEKVNFKVDTVIEHVELNIKNSASGENIHLTDSANSKVVEFGLYGKATQDGEPTPENPIDITVSGSDGSVEVVSCGKNLVDKDNGDFKEWWLNNGKIEKLTVDIAKVSIVLSCEPNTTYSVSKINTTRLRVCSCEEYPIVGKTYKVLCNISSDNVGTSFTTDSACKYVVIQYSNNSGESASTEEILNSLQIEVGNETEYEPYKETVSTIPTPEGLAGIPVESGGNYTDENGQQWVCDEIVKYADGSGKRIQRIGKAVFDGSDDEVIRSSGVNNHGYYSYELLIANCISTKEVPASYSTHFCYKALWQSDTEIFYNADGYVVVLSRFETIDLLREFLNANPVTFIVPITPIITDLTAEEIAEIEKLHTFYPITNIYNDAECGMEVTYIADSKNYIDGQLAIQKAQQEEALATMLLLMPEEVQASMIENDTNNLLNESEV